MWILLMWNTESQLTQNHDTIVYANIQVLYRNEYNRKLFLFIVRQSLSLIQPKQESEIQANLKTHLFWEYLNNLY